MVVVGDLLPGLDIPLGEEDDLRKAGNSGGAIKKLVNGLENIKNMMVNARSSPSSHPPR